MLLSLAAGHSTRLAAAERSGASFGIGATVWCAWWKPFWVDRGEKIPLTSSFKMNNPQAVGGPLLNIVINDRWAISTGFNYGRFKGETVTYFPGLVLTLLTGLPPLSLGIVRKAQRYDFDFIISNRLSRYFKIFWGLKYWGYDLDIQQNLFILSMGTRQTSHNVGPGLGITANIPLVENLFLQPAFSFLVQYSTAQSKESGALAIIGSPGVPGDLLYYGFNATLTFGYHIAKINTTLAIGGRVQYMMIESLSGPEVSKDAYDLFSGITFTVIYTFDLQNPEGGRGKKG